MFNYRSPSFWQLGVVLYFGALILGACAQNEFTGGSGAQHATNQKIPKNPNGDETPGNPNNKISTDDGGKISECGKQQSVEDPNATCSWKSDKRAGGDIKGFVNSFNRYTKVNVGALYFDAATAKFACNLNGYLEATGFTEGSFLSPFNNNIYRWDPTTKKLIESNADLSGNRTIISYACKGKLKDPCHLDKGWIFQNLP